MLQVVFVLDDPSRLKDVLEAWTDGVSAEKERGTADKKPTALERDFTYAIKA